VHAETVRGDEVLGERVAVLVVTEDGVGVDLADTTGHLAGVGLAKTKWHEFVDDVEELPRTGSVMTQGFDQGSWAASGIRTPGHTKGHVVFLDERRDTGYAAEKTR
jgi:glyoxylase-like metal-dependent hydrolase (beta-lactamase superfamily II)